MNEHEREEWSRWLATISEQAPPLAELVDPAWLDVPSLSPEEIQRLETIVREELPGLVERGYVPDLSPLDVDEHLVEPEPVTLQTVIQRELDRLFLQELDEPLLDEKTVRQIERHRQEHDRQEYDFDR
jgi:hypothetical protein